MAGTLVGTAVASFAAAVAIAGHTLAASPAAGTVTPFGGPVPVRLARIGRIDVDFRGSGGVALRRVRCAGATPASQCFVSR